MMRIPSFPNEHNDYPDYSLDSLFREQPEDDLANGCGDAEPQTLDSDVAIPPVLVHLSRSL